MTAIRRRAIFECCKWDPHVEDVEVLYPSPLVLKPREWQGLAGMAEQLAREALEAEAELLQRPELHAKLGLPAPILKVLSKRAGNGAARGAARVMRFDFHFTTEGWRISEGNTDVPGGFIESSGYARLMAEQYPGTSPPGDPATAYARAAKEETGEGAVAGLVHATAYTDDRQVMIYLARHLEQAGLKTCLISPEQLRWSAGEASITTDWFHGRAEILIRFFPAEWLPNLPRRSGWEHFFHGARTPLSNPGAALLTQSKRFPLVWDRLFTSMPTWRALLPETREPNDVPWKQAEEWVLKPALGRVGEGVAIQGVTEPKALKEIARDASKHPRDWAAQQRFETVPLAAEQARIYPCIGVFVIGGAAAGAYGRLAPRPLINYAAWDAAVLIPETDGSPTARNEVTDGKGTDF